MKGLEELHEYCRCMKVRKDVLRLMLLAVLSLLWCRGGAALAQQSFVVMSYNVENLFDLEDNPQQDDDEFLPEGNHHWTRARYERKLHQLAEVLSCAGSVTSFPDLVGLVEVENASVLQDLPLWVRMPIIASLSLRAKIHVVSMWLCSTASRALSSYLPKRLLCTFLLIRLNVPALFSMCQGE